MGYWGVRNFENDDAMEWANDLIGSPNFSLIPHSLKIVTEGGEEFLDAVDCCNALAAAEVVAALKGFPDRHLPQELAAWAEGRPLPDPEWVTLAWKAATRIRRDSELKQVWEDAGYAVHWNAVIDDLIARLRQ